MIVYELFQNEHNEVYQELEISNGARQASFLETIIGISLKTGRPFLSQQIIKALNYHAICCLHINAGEYRPCDVHAGETQFPPPYRVQALMDDFVNNVNRNWSGADPLALAAFVLWRINCIHPFINGNGRTARAVAYYVICVAVGGKLRGTVTLPELLKRDRDEYVKHLQHADQSLAAGEVDLVPLHGMIERLVKEQIATAQQLDDAANTPSTGG